MPPQVLNLAAGTSDPDLLLLRARAYAGDKKLNPALDDLNKVIEEKPELVDAYIERGIVFTQARAASTTPSATSTAPSSSTRRM